MSQDQPNKAYNPSTSGIQEKTFDQILSDFKKSMHRAFHEDADIDEFCSTRGIPPDVLKELMSGNPLALCIPKEYGGFGASIKQNIAFISAAAYESLALALTLGINNGLFIQPFSKYGQESAKQKVFSDFLNKSAMGGLMITEPNFGSDALSMSTSYTEKDGFFHLKGKKHWAGLTGMADFWLLTAREKSESGQLMRDIDMFVCDVNAPKQKILVEEYFENLGLYQIPYGRNILDVQIPENQKLIPQSTGIQMLLDLLHRSRFQFPAMALGFVKRILDEAIAHTHNRIIGNKKLFDYDQVQNRVSRLQANYTICSAFCSNSSEIAALENNLFPYGLEANITKTVTSDLMQESAQSLLQLVGAKGYKLNHFAGRSVVDSRPFQIFEGSNDILYHQIAEAVLKQMKTLKTNNLYVYLSQQIPLAAERIKKLISFDTDYKIAQRKLVKFGQLISRIYAMHYVIKLGNIGFNKDLTDNTITLLEQDISSFINSFHFDNQNKVIANYDDKSDWFYLI